LNKIFKTIIIVAVVLVILLTITPFALLFIDSFSSKVEVNEDLEKYNSAFVDEDSSSRYNSKWGMDESIWPSSIIGLNVLDYKMIYYNPWDAQWVGYLKIKYDDNQYHLEIERLKKCGKTKYIGYYGVTDENDDKIIAINADEYQGFIYALDFGDNIIVYAEQIFCNYQIDFEYEDYVPLEYLLPGFDAHKNNKYQKMKSK